MSIPHLSRQKMIPIVLGFSTMLASSYIDSLRGPLLAFLRTDLTLTDQNLGYFLALGNLGAMLGAAIFMWFMRRRDELSMAPYLIAISCVPSVMIYFLHQNIIWFYLLGFWIGLMSTMLGTLSNLTVMKFAPAKSHGPILSGLHTMFGLASVAATAVFGICAHFGWSWHGAVNLNLAILAVAFFLSQIAAGKKHRSSKDESSSNIDLNKSEEKKYRGFGQTQILLLCLAAFYVAAEVTSSMWLSNYLVQVSQIPLDQASYAGTVFFALMTGTRIVCTRIKSEHLQNQLLWGTLILVSCLQIVGHLGYPWIFAMSGFLGPFFPLLFASISRHFPEQWRVVAVWVIFAIQSMLLFVQLCLGQMADVIGMQYAYMLPLFFLFLSMPCLYFYMRAATHSSRL